MTLHVFAATNAIVLLLVALLFKFEVWNASRVSSLGFAEGVCL